MKRKLFLLITGLTLLVVGCGSLENIFYERNLTNQLGDYRTRLRKLDGKIKADPQNATLYLERGKLLKALDSRKSAMQDYDTAIELNNKYAEAYHSRAWLKYENDWLSKDALSKKGGALNDINTAIELEHDLSNSYYLRGKIFERMDNKEQALRDYSKAIEIDINNGEAFHDRGSLKYFSYHNRDGAMDDLSIALKIFQKKNNKFYYKFTKDLIKHIDETEYDKVRTNKLLNERSERREVKEQS